MKNFNADLIPVEYRGSEGLIKWCRDSLDASDCDPSMWMFNRLHERYEPNIEQKLWLAWLYGNSYWAPTAWVIFQEFPDQDLVDPQRLDNWHSKNWRKLRYQTDCKWSKGHLPKMYESYHNWLDGRLQQDLITNDYEHMQQESQKWFKFGRYSSFFYLQTVSETCGYTFDASNLLLSDHNGSRSHRNGLLISMGNFDGIDARFDDAGYRDLERYGRQIKDEVGCSNFQLETMLCSYKKLAREKQSRYIGYYTDRQKEEIDKTASDGWNGIDWSPWFDARKDQGIIEKKDKQLTLF